MIFKDIKKGDTIYHIEIKDSEIVGGEIQTKIVEDASQYGYTNSREIHFTDDTMIIPDEGKEFVIRGLGVISNALQPVNLTIYATSYESCYNAIKKVVSEKIIQLGDEYKAFNMQMAKLCLMDSIIRDLGVKACVVVDTVYAD